jgi:hypothetical protein
MRVARVARQEGLIVVAALVKKARGQVVGMQGMPLEMVLYRECSASIGWSRGSFLPL